MNDRDIYDQLEPIFCDVLDLPKVELNAGTTAGDVPGWDSVAHIRILIAVEQNLGIEFTSEEINSLQNVGEMVSIIKAKRGAA
jgi:acyl carrier protein